jgi:hypothetical protein
MFFSGVVMAAGYKAFARKVETGFLGAECGKRFGQAVERQAVRSRAFGGENDGPLNLYLFY